MIDEVEIQALIKLLDDDDPEVLQHVETKLVSLGTPVINLLENAWTVDAQPIVQERIQYIIQRIHFQEIIEEWIHWCSEKNPDLLTGVYLVARNFNPELQLESLQKQLLKLRQTIWLELNYNQTPLEQIHIFNQVFYGYHNFAGNQTQTEADDFCIDKALDKRKGNSIIIGIIYQILANDLNIPVYGVNLLRHYILAYCKQTIIDYEDDRLERDIMFYINPVNKGSIFSRTEVKEYLDKLDATHDRRNFVPEGNKKILTELLDYLTETLEYQKHEELLSHLELMQHYLQRE